MLECLQLFAAALKYDFQYNYSDEAFFGYFRIIEKISKDDFEINKVSINKGNQKFKIIIQEILQNNYNVTLSVDKLDNITGIISNNLYEEVFNNVYSKISMCLNNRKIEFDVKKLGEIIHLRNALAHGDIVDMEKHVDELNTVRTITTSLIKFKFFSNVQRVWLESTYIDLYERYMNKKGR